MSRLKILPLIAALAFLPSCGGMTDSYSERLSLPDYYGQGHTVKDRMLAGLQPAESGGSQAGDEEVQLSLQDVVVSVLRNNRDIRVASHRPVQAKAGVLEAQAAYDPEAFAQWEYNKNNNPSKIQGRDSQYYNNTEKVGIRQRIPTGAVISGSREWTHGVEKTQPYPNEHGQGGAYVLEISQPILNGFGDLEVRSAIAVSRVQVGISEEELRQTMMSSTAEAMAHEYVRIYKENLAMAEDLLGREIKRQREGLSTELDVQRAREAVASRATTVLNAQDQQHIYQERLKLVLNNSMYRVGSRTAVKVTENLDTPIITTDLERSLRTAVVWRPEMRQADLAIKAGGIRKKYARHNLLPKLDLIGSVKENDRNADASVPGYEYDSVGRDWSVGVMFTMPIGNMKSRAELSRAESELAQSLDEKRNAEDVIAAEVKTAVKTLELIGQEIPLSERAVAAALKVVDGEWARFELNQVGNRDLLQAQDLLAVSERNRIQSKVRYNVAVIRLLTAEGTLLEHLGVTIDKWRLHSMAKFH